MKVNKEDLVKILKKFGKVNANLKNSYNFIESGFIDSFNLLRFISDIEKKYKIILDDRYTNSKKFGEIGDMVEKINQLKK